MKVGEAEKQMIEQLEGNYGDGEATSIATLVLEEITGWSRSDKWLKKEEELTQPQVSQWESILERLKRNEPVQYILQKGWFYGMELYVDNSVLIPRPETEELVHWIIGDVKASGKDVFERRPMQADVTTQLKILDVGTGSGCIALALKKEMPKAEVWGCDVSDEALNVARRNGSHLDIRVDFQSADFLDTAQQKSLPTVDIVVSNPPYIPLRDKDSMHSNVVEFEPHTALFVPNDDALLFYKALAGFGRHRLYKGGAIYMEIHEDLGPAVTDLFQKEGYPSVEIRKDMQGKNRMVKVSGL